MSSFALQKDVVVALRTALAPVKVYDAVPQNAALPYVVVDSQLAVPTDAVADLHERVTIYLSLWSDATSQAGVLALMAQIKTALHNTKPTLESGSCTILRVMRESTARDVDRKTFIGYVTLEGHVTP